MIYKAWPSPSPIRRTPQIRYALRSFISEVIKKRRKCLLTLLNAKLFGKPRHLYESYARKETDKVDFERFQTIFYTAVGASK